MDDETSLVKRWQHGDPTATGMLIKAHHGFLLALATPLVGRELAKDVAQETWIEAFSGIQRFEGRAKLRTWLARIALNEAYKVLRKHQREVSLDTRGVDPGSPIATRFGAQDAWATPSGLFACCCIGRASACMPCSTISRRKEHADLPGNVGAGLGHHR